MSKLLASLVSLGERESIKVFIVSDSLGSATIYCRYLTNFIKVKDVCRKYDKLLSYINNEGILTALGFETNFQVSQTNFTLLRF